MKSKLNIILIIILVVFLLGLAAFLFRMPSKMSQKLNVLRDNDTTETKVNDSSTSGTSKSKDKSVSKDTVNKDSVDQEIDAIDNSINGADTDSANLDDLQ